MQVTPGAEPARLDGVPGTSQSDSKLAQQRQDEGVAAFEYLCRRHVGPAWDIAYAVTGQRRDSAAAVAEAFLRVLRPGRPARFDSPEALETALLTASRAAAVEAGSRPEDHGTGEELAGSDGSGGERDSGLPVVTAAYRSLPERWRTVLWLTEVRDGGEAEAAAVLGVSASGLAQLTFRARSGMRERYLQAHLRGTVPTGCRPVIEHLGAFVINELPPAELGAIDEHLRCCDHCGELVDDLDDLGAMLARIAVPVPPTLVSMATSRWKAAANAATVVGRSRLGLLSFPSSGRKPLAGAALAVMGLGIIGAAVVTGPLLNHGAGPGGLAPAAAAPTEINQNGSTGGLNPYLLSGNQSPVPPPSAPTTAPAPQTASTTGATTATTAAGKASSGGAPASTAGLLPSPSSPTSTVVPPVTLPPPLPPVTLPPPTLPPVTVPPLISKAVPKLLPGL